MWITCGKGIEKKIKSYDKIKMNSEIIGLSFFFFAQNWPLQGNQFPGVLSAHLYVLEAVESWEMG